MKTRKLPVKNLPEYFGSGSLLSRDDFERYAFFMIAEHHDMDVTTFINEVHGDFRNYIDDDKLYAEYVAWWKRTHSKLGRALK